VRPPSQPHVVTHEGRLHNATRPGTVHRAGDAAWLAGAPLAGWDYGILGGEHFATEVGPVERVAAPNRLLHVLETAESEIEPSPEPAVPEPVEEPEPADDPDKEPARTGSAESLAATLRGVSVTPGW
jgi:hypothetical protein